MYVVYMPSPGQEHGPWVGHILEKVNFQCPRWFGLQPVVLVWGERNQRTNRQTVKGVSRACCTGHVWGNNSQGLIVFSGWGESLLPVKLINTNSSHPYTRTDASFMYENMTTNKYGDMQPGQDFCCIITLCACTFSWLLSNICSSLSWNPV